MTKRQPLEIKCPTQMYRPLYSVERGSESNRSTSLAERIAVGRKRCGTAAVSVTASVVAPTFTAWESCCILDG